MLEILARTFCRILPFLAVLQSVTASGNQTVYPKFLATSSSSAESTPPWGDYTTSNANPYQVSPAGVRTQTRKYTFNLARGTIAPDGTSRSVILVNNQYPGPAIEANWGDTIQVTVNNLIAGPLEGTALHWHGILQNGSPWEDGTPGVSQCPIPPASSHTYTFKADLYGTSFWHSHFSAQYVDGALGPLIVYGPTSAPYDYDLGPVLLTDWSHDSYETQIQQAVGAGKSGLVFASGSLINGQTHANFTVTAGKTYMMRIVNTAAEAPYTFSIDGHEFSVIAHDFVPVQPYTTDQIVLGAAQRADIVFNATGDPTKSYWIRSAPGSCSLVKNLAPATAMLYYEQSIGKQPSSTAQPYSTGCTYQELTSFGIPEYSLTPPAAPASTITMNISSWTNSSGNPLWGINGVAFHANYNEPPLLLAHANELAHPYTPNWAIYNTQNYSSVRLVVYNSDPRTSHPMHLHGHNFWILAEGYGKWNGKVTSSANPPRRDTFMLNAAQSQTVPAYTVIEYLQDNPGVWPFHCHIAWHVSAGLYANILERPQDITTLSIPAKLGATCDNWAYFSKNYFVNEIDSGLR